MRVGLIKLFMFIVIAAESLWLTDTVLGQNLQTKVYPMYSDSTFIAIGNTFLGVMIGLPFLLGIAFLTSKASKARWHRSSNHRWVIGIGGLVAYFSIFLLCFIAWGAWDLERHAPLYYWYEGVMFLVMISALLDADTLMRSEPC